MRLGIDPIQESAHSENSMSESASIRRTRTTKDITMMNTPIHDTEDSKRRPDPVPKVPLAPELTTPPPPQKPLCC